MSFFFQGVVEQVGSPNDERNGEQLPHVEQHCLFKRLLVVFDKLEQETRDKDNEKECSEDEPFVLVGVLAPIEVSTNGECHEAVGHFVELCRVARNGLPVTQEYESPRQGGWSSVDFGVHEIAKSYARAAECDRDDQTVKNPDEPFFADKAVEERHSYENANGSAVAAESSFPNLEQVGGVLQIGVHHAVRRVHPPIEEAMSQARADDGAYCHVDENVVRPRVGQFLVFEHTGYELVADKETYCPHQTVPMDVYGSNAENDGIYVPNNGV